MCCGDENAGPEGDVEFFDELQKVFDKYPEVSQKYAIDMFPSEAERLGVDLESHVGVTRYEDGRIIIEFRSRDELVARRGLCCVWRRGECLRKCEPLE
ncbi:hypothetical protein A5761_14320 [Mycolicibacterium setense]|uniref:Uncharacterized protein n=1 Tax=Mycolicibacterium setense TaxID=431269 RepID=A0ABR4YSS8_9MYCO|nr:hypothetical protein [Mycolicibacterium setense]KHO24003.1 hypothetical protein QQ44_17810 [Mycolicibacterium setense]OBB15272.1 hypothetical protein A5761_14320 [Mycolicibacterium setense]